MRLLRAAPVILAAMLPAGPGFAASAADPIEMRIELYGVAGLHVVTDRIAMVEGGDSYKIDMDIQSRGLTGLIVDLQSHSETVGQLTATSAQPRDFRAWTRRNGERHTTDAQYAADGSAAGQSTSPDVASRSPVTPAEKRGTVDQLTAYFVLERQLARGGSCAFTARIFDGLRRYDLHFTDAAPEALPSGPYRRYAGATRVCHVKREVIGGFPPDPNKDEGTTEGRIWFAPLLPGDLMVPIRLELVTEIGTVTGYLAKLTGRGVNIDFTE